MNELEELGEILLDVNAGTDKILDWYKENKNSDLLKTEAGQRLKKNLCDIALNHAHACLELGNIFLDHSIWLSSH